MIFGLDECPEDGLVSTDLIRQRFWKKAQELDLIENPPPLRQIPQKTEKQLLEEITAVSRRHILDVKGRTNLKKGNQLDNFLREMMTVFGYDTTATSKRMLHRMLQLDDMKPD